MSEENKPSPRFGGMSLGEAAVKAAQEWGGPLTQNHDPSYWKSIREAYACGFMRGYKDCDSRRTAGDREPATPQTAGTKHVGISDLLAVAANFEKLADECKALEQKERNRGETATAVGWKVCAQTYTQCAAAVKRLAENATANEKR